MSGGGVKRRVHCSCIVLSGVVAVRFCPVGWLQLYFYQNVRVRGEMFDRDVTMLQTAAALLDANHFVLHLINKFGLNQWKKSVQIHLLIHVYTYVTRIYVGSGGCLRSILVDWCCCTYLHVGLVDGTYIVLNGQTVKDLFVFLSSSTPKLHLHVRVHVVHVFRLWYTNMDCDVDSH